MAVKQRLIQGPIWRWLDDQCPGGSNKRLDDLVAHLVDQSRRIDALNRRIDKIQAGLSLRLDETNNRLDGSKFNVRRDEYDHLAARVRRLELEVEELKGD